MKNYTATGEELMKSIPMEKQLDTYGNKIEPFFDYVVTVMTENKTKDPLPEGLPNIIIRTRGQYDKDLATLKTMIYTVEGFDRFIEILNEGNFLTIEAKEVKVNEILKTLTETEDFENAGKLTNEWENYKKLNE